VLARFHAEADDGFLAKRLGGFQPVQALDQHETRDVRSHQDWCLLADVEHAGGDSSTRFCTSVAQRFRHARTLASSRS
jgi:hypothetical protein